jgi:hypothetical protein
LTWANPIPNLTSAEEEALIEDFAQKTVKYGLEIPVMTFLDGMTPVSRFVAEIPLLFASPFLTAMGINSYDYVALFSKREVIELIIQRIEQLHEERETIMKKQKKETTSDDSLLNKIKKFITGK